MNERPLISCFQLLTDPVAERLNAGYRVEWNASDGDLTLDQIIDAACRADALVTTVTDPVPAAVFDAPGRRARIVANFGVGVNLIDLEAARRAGVVVTNTPDVLTDCTADLTIGLIIMTLRRLGEGERLLRAGRWTGWRPTHHLGSRVSGRTLGVVGMGRIGTAVARRARHGFGMRIRYASRSPLDSAIEAELGAERRDLDRLLAESDVVTLHTPATAETTGLLDARRIGLLRRDAVLINTARGVLVDETALATALRTGRLAAAGLDVFRREPEIPAELLALENVVLLPHLGSATLETRTAMGMMAVDNLDAFFGGKRPPNRVA